MPDIKTKDGNITAYGFACGYVERIKTEKLHKEIYMEHSHYHVRSSANNCPNLHSKFYGHVSHIFTIWETFSRSELKKARALYNKIK